MGLFTLTAPTGVGKTMAMIHFALRHCVQHQLPRIIVVLPFLTLAEQLQKEYEHIFRKFWWITAKKTYRRRRGSWRQGGTAL